MRWNIRLIFISVGITVAVLIYLYLGSRQLPVAKIHSSSQLSLQRTPEGQTSHRRLDQNYLVPNDVFFVWCASPNAKQFGFRQYLSVRSAVRYLQPDRIVLYNDSEPTVDHGHYYTWLTELRDEYPYFSTQSLPSDACKNRTGFVDEQLAANGGGIYLELSVILATARVHEFRRKTSFVIVDDANVEVLKMMASPAAAADSSGEEKSVTRSSSEVESNDASLVGLQRRCVSFTNQTASLGQLTCLLVDRDIWPKDIWELDTDVGRLLRSVAYDSPELAVARPNYDSLIPNIGHLVWLGGGELKFEFYLGILSVLNVGKVDVLYMHGDVPMSGFYWDHLMEHYGSRVVFVRRSVSPTYFGRKEPLRSRALIADLWRIEILLQYGGIYLDADAIMVRPLTHEIRGYDAVASKDIWTGPIHKYPDTLNLGLALAKPNSRYWKLYQAATRTSVDGADYWYGILLPYKVKERHPNTLRVDPHLQVLCFHLKCHPTWMPDAENLTVNHLTTGELSDWKNATFGYHFTFPTPEEFKSPAALLSGKGVFAEMAQYILEQSKLLDFFRNRLNSSEH